MRPHRVRQTMTRDERWYLWQPQVAHQRSEASRSVPSTAKINVEMIKALPKPLNLDYMINQLQHYHSSYFIKAISWICSKVPAIFRSLIFRVPMGEVILVIRKPLQS